VADPRASDLTQPIPGYEILELLGSGGMSSVYRARHKGLDRRVAIKVIRRDQIDPGLALARLGKEARVLARLDHPAIVRSIDFGEVGDLVYFVMELVEGRSCKQLLIERGRLPLREVLLIGERVALALGHAASHGVIHRDVKPGNILLGKDGSVKLTDFGLARATRDRSLTQDGITVGTPQYMAPEQVRSPRRVDLRSDFYSLGATLYHLATGEPVVRGQSVGEMLHDVLYSSPRPPEQIVPSLPPSFSRLLARLLAKDARRRYASAPELVADLERVRAGLAAGADDESVGLSWQESAEAPARPVKPWLLAGAALVVTAVTAFALLSDRGPRSDPVADARDREDGLLADLAGSLDRGAEAPARILARIGEWRREGVLTSASARARVDLKTRAHGALERELEGAAAAARAAPRSALARADFAGAARTFESDFAERCARIVPRELKAALVAAEVDPQECVRRLSAEHAAEIEALAQRVRRRVGAALLDERYRLTTEVEAAYDEGRLGDVRALFEGHPRRERAACVAATREELADAGVELAADLTDAEVERAWPEIVRNEVDRDPAAALVETGLDELEYVIDRRRRDLLAAIRTACDADGAAAEQDEAEVDPAARRRELERTLAPSIAALAGAGAIPAELEEAWREYDARLEGIRDRRIAQRRRDALARLLEGDGERKGLLRRLLEDRDVEGARQAAAAAEGLAPEDAERWRAAVADVSALLAAARAALEKRAGGAEELRDRGGVAMRGRLHFDARAGTFSIGARSGLRVEDLDVGSLEPLAAGAIESDARRVAALFLLGGKSDHARLDAELERFADDPVIAALRRVRNDEKLDESARRDRNEAAAQEAWTALEKALVEEDPAAAAAAWGTLQALRDSAAGRRALLERERIEGAVAAAKRTARARAVLAAVARNASERTVVGDRNATFTYRFDRIEEGVDFGLTSNAERVENGRLFFVGGRRGLRAREEGPVLRLPLDRRSPAALRVELFAPQEEPRPPHFVALRLGGACVGFFRPDQPKDVTYEPQLSAWFGTLNEFGDHFFVPSLLQSEPRLKGRSAPVGLERATRHVVELKWQPESGSSAGTLEVVLDGERVLSISGAMTTPPEGDCIELRSATALQVDSLGFRGRLRD